MCGRKCAVRLCFSEKMCVRNVLVFVLLCCVNSRAQYSSHGFQNLPENPGMAPQYGANPGLSNTPGNKNVDPQGLDLEIFEHIPVNVENPVLSQNGPPFGISGIPDHSQFDPTPGNPDIPAKSNMHSQHRPPPVILEIPYYPDTNPEYSPFPENPDIPQYPQHGPHHGNPDFLDHPNMHPHKMPPPFQPMPDHVDKNPPEFPGLPQKLEVFPLPLKNSDHELQFNVSWVPTLGVTAREYSLTIRNVKNTIDCESSMCYESSIPGNATWLLVPNPASNIACAMRPGCTYLVSLISHPWDGQTSLNITKELKECEAGVCSCAHWPRLPKPKVSTETVIIKGKRFSKITWTLPTPSEPQRLPPDLRKLSYYVSLGKKMLANKHFPKPWFLNIQKVQVNASGLVSEEDNTTNWQLLPISEKGVPVDAAMVLARVYLVDERGCIGPAGSATAFDPYEQKPAFSFGVYAILGALFGAWAMGAVFVLSARVVKRVLKSFRPAPVSAPLDPLRRRPAWFPLQLRT